MGKVRTKISSNITFGNKVERKNTHYHFRPFSLVWICQWFCTVLTGSPFRHVSPCLWPYLVPSCSPGLLSDLFPIPSKIIIFDLIHMYQSLLVVMYSPLKMKHCFEIHQKAKNKILTLFIVHVHPIALEVELQVKIISAHLLTPTLTSLPPLLNSLARSFDHRNHFKQNVWDTYRVKVIESGWKTIARDHFKYFN